MGLNGKTQMKTDTSIDHKMAAFRLQITTDVADFLEECADSPNTNKLNGKQALQLAAKLVRGAELADYKDFLTSMEVTGEGND